MCETTRQRIDNIIKQTVGRGVIVRGHDRISDRREVVVGMFSKCSAAALLPSQVLLLLLLHK